jgi:NAD(P)-dependent dehydrogenase (short-subunit alcohol dehydrogenase family)
MGQMKKSDFLKSYDFTGMTIAVTGATGVLCSEMAITLADCGATIAMITRNAASAEAVIARSGDGARRMKVFVGDIMSLEGMNKTAAEIAAAFGRVDGLINGAGGNNPKATTNPEQKFFDIPTEAIKYVSDLNLLGTVVPSQAFGKIFAAQKKGVILNVTSMNAFRPLTRIAAYSAAKAAVSNFTMWLAVHMAQEYSTEIRVNAISPGFFLTEQNRFLLTEKETGALTARGKKIIDHTPMGRFGEPNELLGATLWLMSPAAKFVTGTVVAVDGGFSAYSGV